MKNKDTFEIAILNAATLVKQGRLDEVLLAVAKSDLNDSGKLYDLWCDGLGEECSCEECCSDEAQLCCIRRFLERDFSGE